MVEFLFICAFLGFVFVVIKHLSDKWSHKRKIARYQAETDARLATVTSEPVGEICFYVDGLQRNFKDYSFVGESLNLWVPKDEGVKVFDKVYIYHRDGPGGCLGLVPSDYGFKVFRHLLNENYYEIRIEELSDDKCKVKCALFSREETLKRKKRDTKHEHPAIRKHARPEIDKFLDVKRKTRIIVFDLETNGLNGESSVLSCSAIKYEIDPSTCGMTELDRFHRYYYPREQFNPQAFLVNGLTKEAIDQKRGDATYPKYFTDDPDFENFCKGVMRFVAHNISFDAQFIPLIGKKKFCTMMTNMDIVAVQYLERKHQWKWPKLSETAVHYGIQFSENELHSSMADTELTAKIFIKMLDIARVS